MTTDERNVQIHFMVSADEKAMIKQKMSDIGTRNMGAYLRKMAIDGYIIHLDSSDIRELVRILRVTSNSLNQLTKLTHETGSIFVEDIEELRKSYNKMWGVAEEILLRLADI